VTFAEEVHEANEAFDQMCSDRHLMGEEKYGPVKFLDVDTIEMAMEEITDLSNYARYTFIKLWLLRDSLNRHQSAGRDEMGAAAVNNPHLGG